MIDNFIILPLIILLIFMCGYIRRLLDRVNDLENRAPTVIAIPVTTDNVQGLKEHFDWTKQKIQELESKYGTLNSRIKKIRRLIK